MNKTLITFFTLLFCLTSSVSWSETMDDLVERDGVHYKKFTQVPFTGKVDGQENSSWGSYWDKGQLNKKMKWKYGFGVKK